MSHIYSLLSIFLIIFFLKISNIHSNSINSDGISENFDLQSTQNTINYLIKNILMETNINEQIILLNQLREYLNRMCINGYFGSSNTHECQHIVNIVHHYNENKTENNRLQKRFFCNGFIGCKSSGR